MLILVLHVLVHHRLVPDSAPVSTTQNSSTSVTNQETNLRQEGISTANIDDQSLEFSDNHISSESGDTTQVLPGDSTQLNRDPSFSLFLDSFSLTRCVKILTRIPRASRTTAAVVLTSILNEITVFNTLTDWNRLFCFPSRCLRVPTQLDQYTSLSSFVNKLIQSETDPQLLQSPISTTQDFSVTLQKRISAKLNDGDVSGAIRIATSNCDLADVNRDNLSTFFFSKPLQPIPDISLMENINPLISPKDIVKAIHSFSGGSAGGPDGLRPQHLKDLICNSVGKNRALFLKSLTSFINMVLSGKTPPEVRSFFFGASLIPLNDEKGKIKAIPIGCTLRRLASKCAVNKVKQSMRSFLVPHQLGFGIPHGLDSVVHCSRIFWENLKPEQIMLKVNFDNAFNSLYRACALNAVKECFPELLAYSYSSYCTPHVLLFNNEMIKSSEGVQLGDPLGVLLFCLTISNITKNMESDLSVFYLEKGIIGGSIEAVQKDFSKLERTAKELGLHLNHASCEVICNNQVNEFCRSFPRVQVVDSHSFSLLGYPIGNSSIEEVLKGRISYFKQMGSQLGHLPSHQSLCLIKNLVSSPKFLNTLRCTPCFLSSNILQELNSLQRSMLSNVIDSPSGISAQAWHQASLPVRYGGLGIRNPTELALSAFLASASNSYDLVHQILQSTFEYPYNAFNKGFKIWKEGLKNIPPSIKPFSKQRVWDEHSVKASLFQSTADPTYKLRLESAAREESRAWVHTIPSLRLKINDEIIKMAIRQRLGIFCFYKFKSQTNVDISNIVKASLKRCDMIFDSDGSCVILRNNEQSLKLEFFCVDTCAESSSNIYVFPGSVAERKEHLLRVEQLNKKSSSPYYLPLVVETMGVFGPEAMKFFSYLGNRLRLKTDDHRAHFVFLQKLSVAIQCGITP